MNKNREKLLSFIEYCLEHPKERFWQALRNWAGAGFIFIHRSTLPLDFNDLIELQERHELEDTFNIE